jgi:hypothetical protein
LRCCNNEALARGLHVRSSVKAGSGVQANRGKQLTGKLVQGR